MRLSRIRLAGFKSFVDPVTVHLRSNLVGILGPNGCGKSNVIDAVRWVMGESAASRLRGEAMSDVIFSGSATRKPVGQASVELVFDNAEGRLGGAWASYAEISVRRLVNRDGTSQYFLNGTRCRRRDVTELFLGTGLGPRSYAIVEQGMISRVIDARPEELRAFLEEAAGISKYKERRRETETRIRHTRENLDRLADVREELERRLQVLARQARAAEQYRALRAGERELKTGLLALRWQALAAATAALEADGARLETALEAAVAAQRAAEAALGRSRGEQEAAAEALDAVQARHYALGTALARLEQVLAASRERRAREADELERLARALAGLDTQLAADREQLEALAAGIAAGEPALALAQAALAGCHEAQAGAEAALADWQAAHDRIVQSGAEAQRLAEVGRARVEALERRALDAGRRSERLRLELDTLAAAGHAQALGEAEITQRLAAETHAEAELRLAQGDADIDARRAQLAQATRALDALRARVESARGRSAALETLQEAALGRRDDGLQPWLQAQALHAAPRLAEQIAVAPGWETAVEAALGPALEAVLVEALTPPATATPALLRGALMLVEHAGPASGEAVPGAAGMPDMAGMPGMPGAADASAAAAGVTPLRQCVRGPYALAGLLGHVHAVSDLDAALAARAHLAAHECLVTADGVLLGRDWLRLARGAADAQHGVLARERELRTLREALAADVLELQTLEAGLADGRSALGAAELARREAQQAANLAQRELARAAAAAESAAARARHGEARAQAIGAEREELATELTLAQEEAAEQRFVLEDALAAMSAHTEARAQSLAGREALRSALEAARAATRAAQAGEQRLALELGSRRTAFASAGQALARLETQRAEAAARQTRLAAEHAAGDEPEFELAGQLEDRLAARLETEAALAAARDAHAALAEAVRGHERARAQAEAEAGGLRTRLEAARLATQEQRTRRDGLVEALAELSDQAPGALCAQLPADAGEALWQQRLDDTAERLRRLGNVNLSAIEEHDELNGRKGFLDAQHTDLVTALDALEQAMRRIDRETRARMKDTYERVDADLQALFPRLFGGGRAWLAMTGEDLLDAGVTIMAQPPGKKIGSLSLMSGGEKALTAVALVFAIFRLNPAPFCMLDEVDAPLDEANVGRFGRLLREMSERVQFIFITHNKATMEVAEHLAGVTMHEPGVSRLVDVDVAEAVRLAAV